MGTILPPSVSFYTGSQPEHQAVRICIGPPRSDDELVRGAKTLYGLLKKGPFAETPII